jgi:hypothetical protein
MAGNGAATDVPANQLTLDFADGEYVFRLPVGQIAELQQKCDAGVGEIFGRMCAGRYLNDKGEMLLNPALARFKYEDVAETIRLALIGGGGGMANGEAVEVGPVKALQLVRSYVHPRPLLENWRIAYAILAAFMVGYTDPDTTEKKSPRKKRTKATAAAKAGSTST